MQVNKLPEIRKQQAHINHVLHENRVCLASGWLYVPKKKPRRWRGFQCPCGHASAGDDIHEFTLLRSALHKPDNTVSLGKQGMVLAATDVGAGMKMGTTLPDQDIAGMDLLAAETLYAATLGVAVAPVSAGTLSFFVCHGGLLTADGQAETR